MKQNRWSDLEIQLLKDNYDSTSKEEMLELLAPRSWSSILTKANKLGINKRLNWTDSEDKLLKNTYSTTDINEVVRLFPDRTKHSIIARAIKLELNSFDHPIWTDEQVQYIIDNWQILPDEIIGRNINKTKNAVKRKRNLLGLHRQQKGCCYNYENISKYIRGQIWDWKKKSMENCEYKCVITGSKDFEIHHIYPVNKIIKDIYEKYNIEYKDYEDYSKEELSKIVTLFCIEQNTHPLGECIRKDLHKLFHELYGQYNTTYEQWERFKLDIKKGVYDNHIKIDIVA